MVARIAVRFRVTGRVQGVGFRAATARRALALGLVGSSVNRPDGSVEVLVAGSPVAVEQMAEWLAHGPPFANVAGVDRRTEESVGVASGFTVA